MRFCGVCFVLAVPIAGLSQQYRACEAPPKLAEFYAGIKDSSKRAEILRARLESEPDSFFLHRWYLESPQIRTGGLNEQYRRMLDRHPEDARYLYLYGRALMGADTPKAIEYLKRSIEKDPQSPWGYFSLVEVYASPNFKDAAKLGENLLMFTARCPENLDTFKYLRQVDDQGPLRELTARLRQLLEASRGPDSVPYYKILWAAEFRAVDAGKYTGVRARIGEDLRRIKDIDPTNAAVLAQGYKLIGDNAAAETVVRLSPHDTRPRGFPDAFDAWIKDHPYPTQDATAEQKARFYQERLKASEQWLKDWADDSQAYYWHFASLSALKNASTQELEKAGEDLLQMDARQPNRWSPHPYSLAVAQEWNRHDIRLRECIRLAEEAVRKIDRGPGAENDMYRGSEAEAVKAMAHNLAIARFNAFEVQAEASRKLKDLAVTRAVIGKMKEWFESNPGDAPFQEWTYMVQRARLAEAEGHNLDALAYYQRALQRLDHAPEVRERARALWEAQGGGPEAFSVWASRAAPPPKGTLGRPSVATATNLTWRRVHQPLTAMRAPDLRGKVWTVADLKGKITFINVWATWCGPCVAELPQLQALFQLVKDRKEIQVITINVDENPGLVPSFMEKHRYEFPVLLDRSLVADVAPSWSIPRNWIVAGDGILRLESVGFDSRARDWPQLMLEKLMRPVD